MNPRKRLTPSLFAAAALAALALLAGCGGDGDTTTTDAEEAEAAASPAKVMTEIDAVRAGLEEGLAAFEAGETKEAEELVGDVYLEHFELVEHPLEEKNHELMEELEVLISTEIRDAMKEGASVAEVKALIAKANAQLDQAEKELQG